MSLEIRDFHELMEVVVATFPDAEVFEDEDGIVCINTGLILGADETLTKWSDIPENIDDYEIDSAADVSLEELE